MVGVLASSEVNRGFEHRWVILKTIKLVFFGFTPKQPVLRRKRKDWLAQNQDNVSEWGDVYIHGFVSVNYKLEGVAHLSFCFEQTLYRAFHR